MLRHVAFTISVAGCVTFAALIAVSVLFLAPLAVCVALAAIGVWDITQRRHSLCRNYPILARLRFVLQCCTAIARADEDGLTRAIIALAPEPGNENARQ